MAQLTSDSDLLHYAGEALRAFYEGRAGQHGPYTIEVIGSSGARLSRGPIVDLQRPDGGRRVRIIGANILGSVDRVGRGGWAYYLPASSDDWDHRSVIPDGQGWDPRAETYPVSALEFTGVA